VGYLIVLLTSHEQGELLFSSWIFVTGTCVLLSTIIYGLVGIFRRISREDPLTRLANRRCWDERLEEEIERARRSTLPLSMIAIDINNFKSVNTRDGHQGGDRVLRKFAGEWLDAVRGSGDFVARLGGDEFAILAPGTSEAGLNALVQRIRAIQPNGVTCALGTATWNGAESQSEFMHRADQAMYENKPR
jgi:diguanylate cyclase (GGDEF)-like protein